MNIRSIAQKILLVVGLAASVGMTVSLWAYSIAQEKAMREQNERSMAQTVEAAVQSLQGVMQAGDAELSQSIANRLKTIKGAEDFRILRIDGTEAFHDNRTIRTVNKRNGYQAFSERGEDSVIPILPADSPELAQAATGGKTISVYSPSTFGVPSMTTIAPIMASEGCRHCHGGAVRTIGFVKFSVTLASLEHDIAVARKRAQALIIGSLFLTLIFTAAILRYSVSKPIALVTDAMRKAAGGDLNSRAAVRGKDEIAQMASSFNTMTTELLRAHDGMQREQDKLTTIIRSAKEAIIVADANNQITLVNPAAEALLGKTIHDITCGTFIEALDDSALMNRLLNDPAANPEIFQRGEHFLSAQAARICADDGHVTGSALLIRDITTEKTLEAELRRLSTIDGLTGLFNRHFLDETLRKELARAQRYKLSLSILMVDVDHFKKFNDQHGHEMGDRVLKSVAAVMQATLRKQDYACRYGGEEFLAILPDTPGIAAFDTAERLRLAISELQVDGCSVTVSIGCALFPDVMSEFPEDLVRKADAALYEAKRQGRNLCIRADEIQLSNQPTSRIH